MSWRQLPGTKSIDSDTISQISKLRLQNTRLRIEIENMKKQAEPRNDEMNKLIRELAEGKEKDTRIRVQLGRIGLGLGCADVQRAVGIGEGLDLVERKVLEIREKMNGMERELDRRSAADVGQTGQDKLQAKQRQLQILTRRYQLKQQQNRQLAHKLSQLSSSTESLHSQTLKKQSLLAQLSHKVSQLEIEKKDLEAEMKTMRNTNRSEQIKKECEDLLAQVQIKDDDYLKSYLLKNQRFHNNTNSISRKNKYDFIFQQ